MDTDLVITFAQQKTYWLELTATQWISSLAALITFGILVAALIQWHSSQKAHKQSHKPIIRSDFRMPNESNTGHVTLTNAGLGPALLEEINIFVEGEKLDGCLSEASSKAIRKIANAARAHVEITEIQDFQHRYPISGNESKTIIEFSLTGRNSHARFQSEIKDQRVQVEVIYNDIFGKRHRAIDPQPGKEL